GAAHESLLRDGSLPDRLENRPSGLGRDGSVSRRLPSHADTAMPGTDLSPPAPRPLPSIILPAVRRANASGRARSRQLRDPYPDGGGRSSRVGRAAAGCYVSRISTGPPAFSQLRPSERQYHSKTAS